MSTRLPLPLLLLARDPAAGPEMLRHRRLLDQWLADFPDLGAVMEYPLQSGYQYP